MILGGAGITAIGWGLYVVVALHCGAACPGRATLAVPIVGYGLYLADSDRRAAAARSAEREQTVRARGDGCMNSAIGCGFADTIGAVGQVFAWVPTVIEVGGVVIIVVGAATSAANGKEPAPKPVARWAPHMRSVPGGATVGVGGTF